MTIPPSRRNTPTERQDRASRRGPWMREASSGFAWAVRRRIRIGVVALLSVASASLLSCYLFEPFQHSNSHLLLVSGERSVADGSPATLLSAESGLLLNESERVLPAADFVVEDFTAFQTLNSVFALRSVAGESAARGDIRELSDFRRLKSSLDDMTTGRQDVLMLFLAARPRVEDGDASCEWNVRPELAGAEYSRLVEVLRRLSDSTAAVKLLIVDAGRFERDPSRGMVLNEFPHLLRQAVQKTHDSRLWILSSNQPLEHSHISRALERSVFGWFVMLGLEGAADFNHDQQVALDELFRFVSTQVSEFVRQTSGGSEHQKPALLWGGGSLMTQHSWPVLLPVAKRPANRPLIQDPLQWLQSTRQQVRGSAVLSLPHASLTLTPSTQFPNISPPQLPTGNTSRLIPPMPSGMEVRGLDRISANSPTRPTGKESAAAQPAENAAQTAAGAAPNNTAAARNDSAKKAGPGSSEPAGSDGKTSDRNEAIALAALLTETWGLRDELELDPGSVPWPAISATEEWRLLLDRLLLQERLFRAGRVSDHRQVAAVVQTLRDGLQALTRHESLPFQPGQDERTAELIRRIWDRAIQDPCRMIQPHSLGLAELLARRGGHALDTELQAVIGPLDQLIEHGTAEQFQEWVSKLKTEADEFAEIRVARLCSERSDVSWRAKQLALRTCRVAEQIAATDLDCAAWIGPEFEEAERLRKAGERTLLDGIGHDREAVGMKWLEQAWSKYQRAARNVKAICRARELGDLITERLPQYVRWHNESSPDARGAPRGIDVRRLVDDLIQLVTLLDEPDSSQLIEIQGLTSRLSSQRETLEAGLDSSSIRALTAPPSMPGDHLQIEALLNTTLPSQPVRLTLLQTLIEVDRRNVAQFDSPRVFPTSTPDHPLTSTDWEWPARTMELELAIPRLGKINSPNLQPEVDALERTWLEFQNALVKSKKTEASIAPDDSLWDTHRQFSSGLRRFHRVWPSSLASIVQASSGLSNVDLRARQLMELRAARRALHLMPPRSAAIRENPNPAIVLEQAELHDLLAWHARRYEHFRSGAPRNETAELTRLIRSCRTQAARLPDQPTLPREVSPQLQWDGPNALSLAAVSQQMIELQLNWFGVPKTPVRVTIHYDPGLLDVHVNSEDSLQHDKQTSFVEPNLSPLEPVTWLVSPEKPQRLRLDVRRREEAVGPTNLIVYASTSEETARMDIAVSLPSRPTVEVAVEGVAGSWSMTDGKLRLHPFANRSTDYGLSLINRETQPRELSLRWLAARQPIISEMRRIELNATDTTKLMEKIGPTETLVEIADFTIPQDAQPFKIPFPKPLGEPKQTASQSSSLSQEFVLVITDRKTGQSLIQPVVVTPQRPRRFLRPLVRYNADRERIEVTVVPIDNALLPPQGVKVRMHLLEPLPDDASRELEAEIGSPDFEARMFADVAARPEKSVTLQLSVDDYPRAFIFRVPCETNTGNLPAVTDELAVVITASQTRAMFQSPVADVPVDVQVNVPDGAFQIPGDVLEAGIDRNNDRDFRDEPTLRLTSDRQISITAVQFGPEGRFNLLARVGDFQVRVPTIGLRDTNAQYLARLTVADRTVWGVPVRVTFDGAAPHVRIVQLSPAGAVVIGGKLKLTVIASDNDLSGVAKVEAAIDVERTGQFAAIAKPIVLDLTMEGNWEVLVPTGELKSGLHTLLVRATDRVGNMSDITKIRLTAVTPEEAEQLSAVPVPLTGVVTFGGQPVPEARVSAVSADRPKVEPVVTDNTGNFRLNGLTPGTWMLQAKGVTRNKTRTAEVEVTIKASERPQPIEFTLK